MRHASAVLGRLAGWSGHAPRGLAGAERASGLTGQPGRAKDQAQAWQGSSEARQILSAVRLALGGRALTGARIVTTDARDRSRAGGRCALARESLSGCPAVVPKDPIGSQRPVPERPYKSAMPDFLGERRRRNGEHRAPGMGLAVAAYLAGDHPGQRTTTASTNDQQVIRAAGDTDQDPASLAPLHVRLHQWIVRDFSPDRDERIPEPLGGGVPPCLAQIARRLSPVGAITARRHPGNNRYQDGIVGASHDLRIAQCPEAAR